MRGYPEKERARVGKNSKKILARKITIPILNTAQKSGTQQYLTCT